MTSIRPWTGSDLRSILALTDLEHWGFVRDDLTRLMSLAPDGCLLTEEGGTPAAVTTLIRYGDDAWIGTVLVRPDCRGKGVGSVIVEAALLRAGAAGVRTVRIHSYTRTQKFYEGLGFEVESGMTAIRFTTSPPCNGLVEDSFEVPPVPVRPMAVKDLRGVLELDHRLFGSRRDHLIERGLEEFPGLAYLADTVEGRITAFAQARGGTGGIELGPVAVDPGMDSARAAAVARELCRPILRSAAKLGEGVELSCYRMNRPACDLFSGLGFLEGFETVQMVFGEGRAGPDPTGIWALSALEKG
ncbi:GNAT family N-acetyltransferase [Thermodesulfobacteriota bacterium]